MLCSLAGVIRDDGRAIDALPVLVEAARALPPAATRMRAMVLVELANALVDLGQCEKAEPRLREAQQIVDEIGDRLGSGFAAVAAARVHGQRAEWSQVEQYLDHAKDVGRSHDNAELLRLIAQVDADVTHRRGNHRDAAALLHDCIREATLAGDKLAGMRARRLLSTISGSAVSAG